MVVVVVSAKDDTEREERTKQKDERRAAPARSEVATHSTQLCQGFHRRIKKSIGTK